jgi:hypothetical protein
MAQVQFCRKSQQIFSRGLRKKCAEQDWDIHLYALAFFGRPRGRSVASNPSRAAVSCCQRGEKGTFIFMP